MNKIKSEKLVKTNNFEDLEKKPLEINVSDDEDDDETKLNAVGRFILYSAANAYLKNDFEHCLSICLQDYSYVTCMATFTGNILRLKALALQQIYIQQSMTEEKYMKIYER